VVWLVIVFLSVTTGIEKNWLNKLTTLHAPIRISPTDLYYKSYYYQVDSLAAASQYTLKTIGEKADSSLTDPYAEEIDAEIPFYWPPAEKIDPVKSAFKELDQLGLLFLKCPISSPTLKRTPSLNPSFWNRPLKELTVRFFFQKTIKIAASRWETPVH
jgi:hypothetical protein